jgi:capsular polysaccharide biosynthesis protein
LNALRTEGGAVDGTTVGVLLARLRRYWLLVLAVTAVAVLAALAVTSRTPTTYEGRTSLIVSSNNRSPDQDAVLVQGYAVYFDNGAYQRQLLRTAQVPSDVLLSAESAAASPILVISATTTDPETAQAYAIQVAKAFKDDINRVRAQEQAEQLITLQDQLDTALGSNTPADQAVVSDLQGRIEEVRTDQVNVLQELQAQGGVSAHVPSLFGNLLPAVVGGLFLGVVAALVLASLSPRLHSGQDVADKVGLRTLVELPPTRSKEGRPQQEQRLGQLANVARARLTGPRVLAVAQPEEGSAAPLVARALAHEWARQGYATVLVDSGGGILTEGRVATPVMRSGLLPGLSLLQLAPRSTGDAQALALSEISDLLQHEAQAGQYVVVAAPAVVQSAIGQAICQAADQTILVVDSKVTRVPVAREAVAVLRQMGATLMGAVVAAVGEDADQDAPGTHRASSAAGRPSFHQPPPEEPHHRPDLTARVNLAAVDAAPSGGLGQDAEQGRA